MKAEQRSKTGLKRGLTADQKGGIEGYKQRGREDRDRERAEWCVIDMKMRGCLGRSQNTLTPEVWEGLGQVGSAR